MHSFLPLRALVPILLVMSLSGCAVSTVAPQQKALLERMAGEMILVGFRGTSLPEDAPVLQALAQGKASGVILFSRDLLVAGDRNIESPAQVQALTEQLHKAAPWTVFVALDQEGGRVQRLNAKTGFPSFPSARDMGKNEPNDTYGVALEMGALLARAGFNLNFAPVVDLDFPQSPAIGDVDRAFHGDPLQVAEHARAFIRGMNEHGVLTSLKHFPGHGSAGIDTHKGYADITDTWTRAELLPYKMLMDQGYAGMVMVAHVAHRAYGHLPADLNPAIINGLLRTDLGWNGVVVTDDLQMKAITDAYSLEEAILLAVEAGADLLVFGNNTADYDPYLAFTVHKAIMDHVAAGRISPARIAASWQRIQALKARLSQ